MASSDPIKYPYAVDYNDHFETPIVAYRDICPLLDAVQPQPPSASASKADSQETMRSRHTIYDPYYCNGRTKRLLGTLGFTKVQHEKRDFYKDVEKNQVPKYHTLITNPPYSDDHKEKCVRYAVSQLRGNNANGAKDAAKPFFILMPNYVACRNHFRSSVLSNVVAQGQDSSEDPLDILYVVPSTPYEYEHPEGTGKDLPPFSSIWFCGIPAGKVDAAKKAFRKTHGENSVGILQNGQSQSDSPRLVSTLQELRALGAVPTAKRKNLKQRLKVKRKLEQADNYAVGTPTTARNEIKAVSQKNNNQSTAPTPNPASHNGKKSKHRDESGARKKKRF